MASSGFSALFSLSGNVEEEEEVEVDKEQEAEEEEEEGEEDSTSWVTCLIITTSPPAPRSLTQHMRSNIAQAPAQRAAPA